MHKTLFQAQLAKAGACREARRWVADKTAREAWELCQDGFWMDWLLVNLTSLAYLDIDRRLRHMAYSTPAAYADVLRLAYPFREVQRLVAERWLATR